MDSETAERNLIVTGKLKKREEERIAGVSRRKLEKDNVASAQENFEYFSDNFNKEKLMLEKRLESCDSLPKIDLQSEFDSITQDFQKLQKFISDSTMFLPPFELEKALEQLKKTYMQIQEKKDELLPKKKFAFRSKKKVAEKMTKMEQSTNGVHSNGSMSSSSASNMSNSDVQIELAECKLVNHSNENLSMDASAIEQKDVALASLSKCEIRLLGAPSTVHIKNLTDCVVLCGPVSSSIFISDCSNCTFVIACQQLRTHTSKNCVFYLHVTSRAIIEDCSSLDFAPYNLTYLDMEEHFTKSGLDKIRNNWSDVDDFNWLASDAHSPNWAILPEDKRKQNWLE